MLNQNKENQLNNWLEKSVQNNKIPFGEISISKENKNIYNYKIYTQDEKYKNNKLYRIHSLSKPITSLVSLIVLEKNNINLKEPISTFVPAFSKAKVLVNEELININTPLFYLYFLPHESLKLTVRLNIGLFSPLSSSRQKYPIRSNCTGSVHDALESEGSNKQSATV